MRTHFICWRLAAVLLVASSAFSFTVHGQDRLYALMSAGGDGYGSIVSIIPGNNALSDVIPIPGSNPGAGPGYTQMVEAPNGKLYGLTINGGGPGQGVIFEYDPGWNEYTMVHDFNLSTDGQGAFGSLLLGSDGMLYGTCFGGGVNGGGTIYRVDPNTHSFLVLYSFSSPSGNWPATGRMTEVSPGVFIGITQFGGPTGFGVIYEFNSNTSTYTMLRDINTYTGGEHGVGTLVQGTDGLYYGSTLQGGANGLGVLFAYDYNLNTLTAVHDMTTAGGAYMNGFLCHASNGKMYGNGSGGGANNLGTLFEYDYINDIYTVVHNYSASGGNMPSCCSLFQANNGLLYGVTNYGGTGGSGELFSFNINTLTYTSLADMTAIGGANGTGAVVQHSNGSLYGLTAAGGLGASGVIFEYNIGVPYFLKKQDFAVSPNGLTPFSSMLLAQNDKMYGTMTFQNAGFGTIFEFDQTTNVFTTKHTFNGTDGGLPHNSMVEVSPGMLYGATHTGGVNNSGTIFSFNYLTNTHTKLYDLSNGSSAPGGITAGPPGKLYGTSWTGGANNLGYIYEFDYNTLTLTVLHDFAGPEGANPFHTPVLASDGNLYGLCETGGSFGSGVIYKYDLVLNTYSNLLDFNVTNGAGPRGGLIEGSDGKLYGTTIGGGTWGAGTFFSFNPSGSIHTILHEFITSTGATPIGGVVTESSPGVFYGLTSYGGGPDNYGVIYEYNTGTSTYTVRFNLDRQTGGTPLYSSLVMAAPCVPATLPVVNSPNLNLCAPQSTTLTVVGGNLNSNTDWVWYTGGCGGTQIGINSIVVSPSVTTTYHVRGEGGSCAPDGPCMSITVFVNTPFSWWLDADNDGYSAATQLACSSPGAGWTSTAPPFNGDCNDASAAINPGASEICANLIDDDCDGFIDEGCGAPVNDQKTSAINLVVNNLGSCTYTNGTVVGATVSPQSNSVAVTGEDVWYSFTAPEPGIRISVVTSSFDALIELQNNTGATIDSENVVSGVGGEALNFGSSLVPGQTYYISVRNYNSSSGSGTFTICLEKLKDSACAYGPGPYANTCATFKAVNTSAYSYTFNFVNLTTTQPTSVTVVASTVTTLGALLPGYTYSVNIACTYALMNGLNQVEMITINSLNPCTLIMNNHPDIDLRPTDSCPNIKTANAVIGAVSWLCGASYYEWEFDPVGPGATLYANGPANSRFIALSTVPGITPGAQYNVRIRPWFQGGTVAGNFYTNTQCLQIASPPPMILEQTDEFGHALDTRGTFEVGRSYSVYPNPISGKTFFVSCTTEWSLQTKVRIFDLSGKELAVKWAYNSESNRVEVAFEHEPASGLYLIQLSDGERSEGLRLEVQ